MQIPQRHSIVHAVLVLFAVALLVKAARVQLAEHEKWASAATRQHTAEATIAAPRGDIEDAAGYTLAHSRELVRLGFSLDLIRDRRALYNSLRKLGVPANRARPVLDRKRRWYDLRQNFQPSQVAKLMLVKGVRSFPSGDREYVQSEGSRRVLGHVSPDGKGVDGLELYLDSLLTGRPGLARTLRTGSGKRFDSPDILTDPPRRGHTVRLTINQGLQDICDEAITDASRRLEADGGDIVVLDPHTGEIRCLASHRRGATRGSVATILEPFEPGSTLKPFLVGRLLEQGLARADEWVETYNGVYAVNGRRITDVHKAERLTVSGIIQYSSNVGIARLSERLSDAELFTLYRDLGFGTATGLPFPTEASGTLYEPRRWSRPTHHSLAIGYEVAVTPLQLALSYGAIANGGALMAPGLIREIRDADGTVVYAHRPRVVRRVYETRTTRDVMAMLESVVDSGTAKDASLASFTLAGKSGTARRVTGGRYAGKGGMTYTSSFVGLFPAKKPQYVVLVKMDNPRGTYYGGKTAAPVAKAVIQAALAARDASLEWGELPPQRAAYTPPPSQVARAENAEAADTAESEEIAIASGVAPAAAESTGVLLPTIPLVDSTPDPEERPPTRFDLAKPLVHESPKPRQAVVPDVRGLPLRVAVRELHRAGFRVQLLPRGGGMSPAAGSEITTGSLVRLPRP